MPDSPTLSVEQQPGPYAVGDGVTFRVRDGEGLPYRVTWDGVELIEEGIIRGDEITVVAKSCGFLRLTVGGAGSPTVEAAAAIAPESIVPTLAVPNDFGDFWPRQLDRLPETTPNPRIEPYEEHDTDRIMKLSVESGDPEIGSVHGWLHLPKGEGPFPAVVRYHGAGVYSVPTENSREWAQRGWMCLSMNAHPIPNDRPASFYDDLRGAELANYRIHGRDSRETLYFVPMFLRAALAARAMTLLPEWDGVHLISEGHSQGGGQAFAAAALADRMSALIVSCPTHCDHAGPLNGRPAGWPQIVEWQNGAPDTAQLEATRYIDGVNFATRIAVPALAGVCYLDAACPPTGIYAALNGLTGPVEVHHEPSIAHIYTEGFHEATFRWAASYLAGEH